MYAATEGPNVKWGAPISNRGAGHHCPPAGDGTEQRLISTTQLPPAPLSITVHRKPTCQTATYFQQSSVNCCETQRRAHVIPGFSNNVTSLVTKAARQTPHQQVFRRHVFSTLIARYEVAFANMR